MLGSRFQCYYPSDSVAHWIASSLFYNTTKHFHVGNNDQFASRFKGIHSLKVLFFFFSTGEFEELKDTVTCLCKGDYFTALKGKTSQHLLHLAAASTGEILIIYHQNNFVGSLCFIVLLTGELISFVG